MANIVSSDDFTNSALADNGVEISRKPVITTYTGNGDEVITDGTPENITVILHTRQPNYIQTESGQQLRVDGYIMTSPTQTINKNDEITYDSKTYRVISVNTRGPSGDVVIYKYCEITRIA